jgi:hypothetical protein
MKVYLDDTRNAPEGWDLVRSPFAAIVLLRLQSGMIAELSLDHDIDTRMPTGGTGYDVLVWLEERVANDPSFPVPPVIKIHSANASVYRKMEQAIDSIHRLAA